MRRTQGEKDAMKDAAADAKYRHSKRKKNGLCVWCGENPQNPALGPVCLDCFESEKHTGCSREGCINPPVATWYHSDLCEVHLINAVHSNYDRYLSIKSKLDNLREERERLEKIMEEQGIEPVTWDKSVAETEVNEEYVEVRHEIHELSAELGMLKKNIERAKSSVDQLFPENYEVNQ